MAVPREDEFVDTGTLDANHAYLTGFEGALVYGPFSFQGEGMIAWTGSDADDPTVKDAVDGATFAAFYVMLSYFLTGEHRPYSLPNATFRRPHPRKNVLRDGWGAWEIAFRFSYINLNDADALNPTSGGEEHNLTFGINWYLNPNTRMTWNYVYGEVDRLVSVEDNAGNTSLIDVDHDRFGIFMMRFQVDF